MEYKILLKESNHEEELEVLKSGEELLALEKSFCEQPTQERLMQLIDCFTDTLLFVPMHVIISEKNAEIMRKMKNGEEASLAEGLRFRPDYLQTSDGKSFLQVFSQEEQVDKKYLKSISSLWMPASEVVEFYQHPKSKLDGIVLDPHTNNIVFTKEQIQLMDDMIKEKEVVESE